MRAFVGFHRAGNFTYATARIEKLLIKLLNRAISFCLQPKRSICEESEKRKGAKLKLALE